METASINDTIFVANTQPTLPIVDITMFDSIPSEYHLPLVAAVGLIGFFLVIVLSKVTTKASPATSTTSGASAATSNKKTSIPIKVTNSKPVMNPSTPPRSSTRTPEKGSLMTPSGRRSARVAASRRKDE
mmetsp:Transcript_13365/g.22130  ORF Transcript_13365/g.22130 Transcript_13365/m.22130 type:complete len:130 (+) Transcript_13365:106-495(+)|eukprot:CAMPEP_0119010396 /NCGR_PEP_ID=MMETSP1176-20130426/4983_1 /TAXON_ID=265551 /ORGANISM="Synedropsis recta cf, Strain CCMP1620" /LENGTH=129 /DNA_ID=CAMNT_0006963043 /DNA_START=20 /DNA_END=409 /DNA_ORIENTATION=+